MTRKTGVVAILAMAGMGFGAMAFAAGPASPPAEEAAGEPQAAQQAGGSNRGYVVGDGGVARLQGSPASGQSAEIGINEPGINRKAKREAPPRQTATPEPKPPHGD